ncbi:hypothetical protein RvY_14786 [Ramazzottius varieornatus]|uniref:Uncharacterized protein n=1 Tax=Ramazzottius varieornatus TaxID=947166 RepID=A0A1D1VSH5_RAMVA|nr:hypothetical protein RvY_14786 [Ramazzottius varieornatus]
MDVTAMLGYVIATVGFISSKNQFGGFVVVQSGQILVVVIRILIMSVPLAGIYEEVHVNNLIIAMDITTDTRFSGPREYWLPLFPLVDVIGS